MHLFLVAMARNLREEILEAAAQLFYRQGIKATGVDAVVKAAGTTKMSLYKYFPSKNDLVLAYLRGKSAAMQAKLRGELETRAAGPRQRLLAIFDVFGEWLANPDFRGCPFINASAEFAEEDDPVHQATREFYDGFRAELAQWAREAECSNPENLAGQLALLIAGSIVAEQMQRNSGMLLQARDAAEVLIRESLA
jgi:AcrR family transcriptional regulator